VNVFAIMAIVYPLPPAVNRHSVGFRLRFDNGPMLFELEHVSLRRGGEQVLTDLSARIPEGASAIVGPSGSGKSSLLRLLDRLSDAEAGTVRFRGRDTRELDPLELRREVALVPQLPALLEGTVEANLRFAAGLAGTEADTERLLALAGLDPSFAERDVRRLSVGEQQRAMIARALAGGPRVLLLDEPTSALDEDARDSIERTVADLRRSVGASIVIVTHDPAQARRLADWIVRLDGGRLVHEGEVSEVLT
jgi:UDP-glucose/iron transport system ATP-binding protein